jgi:hypothetical protein
MWFIIPEGYNQEYLNSEDGPMKFGVRDICICHWKILANYETYVSLRSRSALLTDHAK